MKPKRAGWMFALAALFAVGVAGANVQQEGAWPEKEEKIDLDFDSVPPSEAIRLLAKAAGWTVVVHAPPGQPVSLHANDEDPAKLLAAILADGDYIARRDGNVITIQNKPKTENAAPPTAASASAPAGASATASVPPPVPSPPLPPKGPVAARTGEDRDVSGSNARIGRDEVVRDLKVVGGNVDLLGTVTGDLEVTGGNVRMLEDARVMGDAKVLGGNIELRDRSRIDGRVKTVFGDVRRKDQSAIGGGIEQSAQVGPLNIQVTDDDTEPKKPKAEKPFFTRALDEIGDAMSGAAAFFVIGAIFLALAPRRMENLRVEVASRPMRTLALGVVATLASIILAAAICVTIIGIPIVIVAVLVAVVGMFAGMCAVLSVVGEALAKHRTKSGYVHLAIGCAILFLLTMIPKVDGIVMTVVTFIGIGSLAATRFAGFLPAKKAASAGPYRTPSET